VSLTSRKGAQTHKAPISLLCGLCYSKGKLQLLIPAAEDNQCLVLGYAKLCLYSSLLNEIVFEAGLELVGHQNSVRVTGAGLGLGSG